MADTDLLFSQARPAPGGPVRIVFGDDDDGPSGGSVELHASGAITGLRGHVVLRRGVRLAAGGGITGLRGHVGLRYDINVDRSMVGVVRQCWQDAKRRSVPTQGRYQQAQPLQHVAQSVWQDARTLQHLVQARWEDAQRLATLTAQGWQDAQRLATQPVLQAWQEAQRLRHGTVQRFEQGRRVSAGTLQRYQEALRLRTSTLQRFEEGRTLGRPWASTMGHARPVSVLWVGRYEEAGPPRPGITVITPPQPDPCYVPELPAHLVFDGAADSSLSAHLVFVCDRHAPDPEPGATVVIPIKNVYMVLNDATLTRVDGSLPIPTYSMSMSLDVDSWTWSFSASVPGLALGDLEPSSYGEPVEVQASINGVPYRFLVETIGRDRGFADSRLRISGRGKSALLDNPYSAQMVFGNEFNRTAQQLMGDVLTLNGVPIDWNIQWEIDDWYVPAGVFSHTGSYMSALLQIAGAPGAYIQPHATAQTLYVKPRFPDLPSKWGDLTPDIELPSAGVTRESIEWRNLPAYNRVFVSGTSEGVVGQVTLAGTDGSLVAPMVTDPLITEGVAARQRGLAALSETGRQVPFNLRMPIFPETGIIPPGKLVRYVDNGVPRLGITRSVQVEVGLPAIWQTVALESYE